MAGHTLAPSTSQVAAAFADQKPEGVEVESAADAPVKALDPQELLLVGQKFQFLFMQYVSDRRIAELRWERNERQLLGIYDPEIEKELSANRSKAYPRVTRTKCISVVSRLMSLMFPGNERNWEIKASPSPDMKVEDVLEAIKEQQAKDQAANVPVTIDDDYVQTAVQVLADSRAEDLCLIIDDQLEELGGHQTLDYIALNRKVVQSGVQYGVGALEGPYAKKCKKTVWSAGDNGQPQVKEKTYYRPYFEILKIWDFYPDMSAKTFAEMDGYFKRKVMSRHQVRQLADRMDFMKAQIEEYLKNHQMGNYRPQPFELDLRAMGVRVNVNEMKTETSKYEVIVWKGAISGAFLRMAGVDVAEDKLADEMDGEVWLIDGNVIKCVLNPWKSLGVDVKMLHTFLFDEDDTSPVGYGLPNAIRDSQMAISASTRMLLDNASMVCGPNLELNTDLLRADQDLKTITAYKIWYREGVGPDAQYPAVKNLDINAHLSDLQGMITMFKKQADDETFVGPTTGGDMENGPSEPLRTAAGASMLRGDAALPFKDVVRAYDTFTQSVIDSMVQFNRKFNPDMVKGGDYNIVARGATSMVAKEVRGMQMDQLATTMTDEEKLHIDMRKFAKERLLVRDMGDMLVSDEEADRRKKVQDASAQQQQQQQQEVIEATIRKTLSEAFKNIAQAQKNAAGADAEAVETSLKILEQGAMGVLGQGAQNGGQPTASGQPGSDAGETAGGADGSDTGQSGGPNGGPGLGMPPAAGGSPQGSPAGMP